MLWKKGKSLKEKHFQTIELMLAKAGRGYTYDIRKAH